MKPGLNGYRVTVLAGIGLLIFLLGVMVVNLLSQSRDLSRAADDNLQWSISQIDTEFANLDAALSDQIAARSLTSEEVELRIDIALSRLNIVNSGRSAEIFAGSSEAAGLIAPINSFAEQAIALVDKPGPLQGDDIVAMKRLVSEVRPYVRDVALLGIQLGAERSEARRAQFSNQLSRTGGIAIALVILMGILMLFLDRLLQRAARRDADLSASTRELASTVAASLDAIVTADAGGRILNYNTSAERVFGWTRDEILGRKMEDTFIPARMRDAHRNGMKRYLDTGVPKVVDAGRVELPAQRKSGEEFPVELNITTTQVGEETLFIAYIRDISERKINEQKLIDARDRAERTDKAKSQFLTVMSHEMRTPLNGVLGVLDLLKTTSLDEQQTRYARIATSSSEILLEHVNEALDITRIETGELQLTLQDFALTELMQGLVDVFDPLAREKDLYVTLDIEPVMRGPYFGDAGRIRQILTNLIGNAIKFTDEGGIHIRVSGIHGPENTSLRFEVTDTGIGISASQQEQVFEDFFAIAQSEGRQTRGDGLGLSISRRIARAMDGDVVLKQTTGAGSTFVLTLPVQRSEGPISAVPEPKAAPTSAGRACRVLIVEDNTINRSVLGDMLKAMGHTVHEAVNGLDCIAIADSMPFDIIFMDISMPAMDGIEATQYLRHGGGPNARAHIVGLTAHGREEYRDSAVVAGMDRFHTKPIRLEALHGILAEVSDVKRAPSKAPQMPDALGEMINVLGRAKVAEIARAFLAELSSFIDALRAADAETDLPSLAEAAHKAKGAASLLGQADLQQVLASVEDDARAGTLTDLTDWANALDQDAARCKIRFDAALKRADDTP